MNKFWRKKVLWGTVFCAVLVLGATLCFGLPSVAKANAEIAPAVYTVADLNGYNSPTDFNWMSKNWNVKTICGTAVHDPSGGYGAPCYMRNFVTENDYYLTYGVSTNRPHSTASFTFKDSVEKRKIGDEIDSLVIRMYAHLSLDTSTGYYTAKGGVRLYSSDDDGTNDSGYMLAKDIPQNQWYYLALSGEELETFADKDGYFSGFAIASNCSGGAGVEETDGKMYAGGGWTNEANAKTNVAWIAFDTFSVNSYVVTFRDGDDVTQQIVEKNGKAEQPSTIPTKEGYTLLGWYDESGKKVDLTAGVKKSCTLTAKWQPTGGVLEAKNGGVYGYSDASNANRKVKQIYGENLTVQDAMLWVSATSAIGKNAPVGFPIYSVSTNRVGASPTITFANQGISLKNADGSWKGIVVRIYAHLTTDKSAYYTEKGGIRLYGADDDGTNNSGYMLPADIAQDEWVYLEIPGEYLADQNGDFSGFAVGSNVEGGASGKEGKKMYAGGSWSAEGSYVLFDTFTVGSHPVTFRDGNSVTQQLIAENGKAIAPEAKGKAFDETYHYTFDGWYNGEQKWNFEDAVTASMTLECRYVGKAHVYGEGVITPPTQTEKGYTTYTCTCGHSYRGDETETLPADETLVNIYGTSLSVEDRIGLNIYVNKLTEKKVFMLVTTSNGEERVAHRDIKSGYYRYTIYLPAQDYAKEVAFTFVDEDGLRSKTYRYSIKAYAEQAKNNPSVDENTKAVIAAMEDYATLAKAYFNDEQATVPETVANVQNAVFDTYTVATGGSLPAGVSVKGITLIFNSEITLRLYCVFDESVNASDIAVTVNGTAAKWQEKTIDGVKYHYVDFSGIAAADLDSVIVFKIGDCTVSCSALSYANVILKNGTQNETLINTLKALYLYHNACKTCFAK